MLRLLGNTSPQMKLISLIDLREINFICGLVFPSNLSLFNVCACVRVCVCVHVRVQNVHCATSSLHVLAIILFHVAPLLL